MITLEAKLPDSPGSLIELITPISNQGANIYGILHHHDKKVGNMIPVTITFELTEELMETGLAKIREDLSKKQISVDKVTKGDKTRHMTVILTGHVFDTDVVDTIERLADKKINVRELQAKFTSMTDISNTKLTFEFPESMTQEDLMEEIKKICREKGLFLIRS